MKTTVLTALLLVGCVSALPLVDNIEQFFSNSRAIRAANRDRPEDKPDERISEEVKECFRELIEVLKPAVERSRNERDLTLRQAVCQMFPADKLAELRDHYQRCKAIFLDNDPNSGKPKINSDRRDESHFLKLKEIFESKEMCAEPESHGPHESGSGGHRPDSSVSGSGGRRPGGSGSRTGDRRPGGSGSGSDSRRPGGSGSGSDSRRPGGSDSRRPGSTGSGSDNRRPGGAGSDTGDRRPSDTGSRSDSRRPGGSGSGSDSRRPGGSGSGSDSRRPGGSGSGSDSRRPGGAGSGSDSRRPGGAGSDTGDPRPGSTGSGSDSRRPGGADSRPGGIPEEAENCFRELTEVLKPAAALIRGGDMTLLQALCTIDPSINWEELRFHYRTCKEIYINNNQDADKQRNPPHNGGESIFSKLRQIFASEELPTCAQIRPGDAGAGGSRFGSGRPESGSGSGSVRPGSGSSRPGSGSGSEIDRPGSGGSRPGSGSSRPGSGSDGRRPDGSGSRPGGIPEEAEDCFRELTEVLKPAAEMVRGSDMTLLQALCTMFPSEHLRALRDHYFECKATYMQNVPSHRADDSHFINLEKLFKSEEMCDSIEPEDPRVSDRGSGSSSGDRRPDFSHSGSGGNRPDGTITGDRHRGSGSADRRPGGSGSRPGGNDPDGSGSGDRRPGSSSSGSEVKRPGGSERRPGGNRPGGSVSGDRRPGIPDEAEECFRELSEVLKPAIELLGRMRGLTLQQAICKIDPAIDWEELRFHYDTCKDIYGNNDQDADEQRVSPHKAAGDLFLKLGKILASNEPPTCAPTGPSDVGAGGNRFDSARPGSGSVSESGRPGSGGSRPGSGGSRPGSGGSRPGSGGSRPGSDGSRPGSGDSRPGSDSVSESGRPGSGGSRPGSGGSRPGSGGSRPGSGGSRPGSDGSRPGSGDSRPGSDSVSESGRPDSGSGRPSFRRG